MKINLEFKVLPFQVPVSVSLVSNKSVEYAYNNSIPVPPPPKPVPPSTKPAPADEDGVVLRNIKLSSLSADALEKLCNEFTDAVFNEAGKGRPAQAEKARPRLHLEDGPVYQELQRDLKTCVDLITRSQFGEAVLTLNKWIDDK